MDEKFYTLKGYKIKNEEILSSSMEDSLKITGTVEIAAPGSGLPDKHKVLQKQ